MVRQVVSVVIALALTGCVPAWVIDGVAAGNPGCLYSVPRPSGDKTVALTLDDGPDSATTPELLRILASNNARATFFLISGNVRGNDTLVARLVREGHEIGNHFSENEASISLSPPEFVRSFLTADSVLRKFAPVRWVRPGSGRYNKRMVRTFREHGYRCALGSVYPFDPQIPLPGYSRWMISHHIRPGAIIILHDGGYKGSNTIKTLSTLLPDFEATRISNRHLERAHGARNAVSRTLGGLTTPGNPRRPSSSPMRRNPFSASPTSHALP